MQSQSLSSRKLSIHQVWFLHLFPDLSYWQKWKVKLQCPKIGNRTAVLILLLTIMFCIYITSFETDNCHLQYICLLIFIYIYLTFFGRIRTTWVSNSLELGQTPSGLASCTKLFAKVATIRLQSSKGLKWWASFQGTQLLVLTAVL